MVFFPVLEVPTSLRKCYTKSFADDRIEVREFMLNVLDIPWLSVSSDTDSGSELVIWCWVVERD